MKVLIVEAHSAPYRDPAFEKLASDLDGQIRILTETSIGMGAATHSEWSYRSPMEKYRKYVGKPISLSYIRYTKGYIKELLNCRPAAVVCCSFIEAILAKVICNARVVWSADTIRCGRYGKQRWNKIWLNWMYRRADAFWVPGSKSKAYFEQYVGNERPIYLGSYTDDCVNQMKKVNDSFKIRSSLRNELGISQNSFVFLFVGKLIESRNIGILLGAAERISNENQKIEILVIGEGEENYKIEEYSNKYSNVKWIPRVRRSELEKYYAIADAYVHPGEEPYSLATYEAASVGLPIVASNKVGCVADCVDDGRTGYLAEFGNTEDFYDKMICVTQGMLDQKDVLDMRDFIQNHRGPVWAAKQLEKACGL